MKRESLEENLAESTIMETEVNRAENREKNRAENTENTENTERNAPYDAGSQLRGTGNYSRRGTRRRKLNIGGIKYGIILASGGVVGAVSGATGVGSTTMFAPVLTWMLGFKNEKAQANALTFACLASAAAVAGLIVGNGTTGAVWWQGLLLTLGGILGAGFCGGIAKHLKTLAAKRFMAGLGIVFATAVIFHTARLGGPFAGRPNFADWSSPLSLLLLGTIGGGVTALTGWVGGTFLVPALFYMTARSNGNINHATEAVALSMLVIVLASLLPAVAYSRTGRVDKTYFSPMVIGGLLGGFAGGWVVPRIEEKFVIMVSAVIAMFLCARDLSQLVNSSESAEDRVSADAEL